MTKNLLPIFGLLSISFSASCFADSAKTTNSQSEQVTEFTMANVTNLNEAKMSEFKKSLENSISNKGINSKMSLDLVAQIYLQSAQSIIDHPDEFKKLFDNYENEKTKNSYEFIARSSTFIDVNIPSKIIIKPDNLLKNTNKMSYEVLNINNINMKKFHLKNDYNVNCVALFKFTGELSLERIYGEGISISCLDEKNKLITKPFGAVLVDNDNTYGLNSSLVLDPNVESSTKAKLTLVFDNTHPVKIVIYNSVVLPSTKKIME